MLEFGEIAYFPLFFKAANEPVKTALTISNSCAVSAPKKEHSGTRRPLVQGTSHPRRVLHFAKRICSLSQTAGPFFLLPCHRVHDFNRRQMNPPQDGVFKFNFNVEERGAR